MRKITKAVVPAAGFGTRFLPWAKAVPKQMLPIVDKPVVQIVIEQLVEVGIKEIYLIISSDNKTIMNHFQKNLLLENQLKKVNKQKELDQIRKIEKLAKIHFLYQTKNDPYGNGTPILKAAKYLGREPFVYCWADEFVLASPPVMEQIVKAYENCHASIMTVIRVTKDEDYQRYGFVAGEKTDEGLIRIHKVVEKPGIGNAPSDLATIAPFIFNPSIIKAMFEAKKQLQPGKELYYNDAIKILLRKEPFYALEIKNYRYYDTGSKLEYLKTMVELGLQHPEIGENFRKYLRRLTCNL